MAIPLSRSADELIRLLRRVLTQGGNANVLQVSAGEVYIRFIAERGSPRLRCEACSNRHLSPAGRLLEADLLRLQRLGFEVPSDGSAYVRITAVEDEGALADLAQQTVRILTSIYRCDPRQIVSVRVDLRDTGPRNPDVLRLLEEIHHANSPRTWQRLFEVLRVSKLIVPVDESNTALFLHGPDGETVLGVFTDHEAVVKFWPNGRKYVAMPAVEFFPWARKHRLWPVVINPGGPVAGELGEEHVELLAATVRKPQASPVNSV